MAHMQKGYVLSNQCPSREILEHLTSKWAVLVLRSLGDGIQRFSELKRRIEGVSEKMLTQTLKMLEKDGFITRTVYPEVPPKVEYELTKIGQQAERQLDLFVSWIEENLDEIIFQRKIEDVA
ncbi:helix-turn-helix domain-containing protein [Acinetobacter sp. MD2(2019)]|uniref:winged helix-turn-helix transcriptional regulator n=1 Tax=Acinetobacter sp. MD2(2019) TaxID=2605273 RepID=UPI002D767A13|nr:helix-turn-helix domain-containing protein [Acinetobacter sp. MD2(2019)]